MASDLTCVSTVLNRSSDSSKEKQLLYKNAILILLGEKKMSLRTSAL